MSDFVEDPPRTASSDDKTTADTLLLNIDGYEGPIDVLLDLARNQKVDLLQISVYQLARQYLLFVERAKEQNLELAAEYLVMAAWLAYLKSRLLLPKEDLLDNEPSAEEMAEALQFQLRRREAMQMAAEKLMTKPQLGSGIYARGAPEGLPTQTSTTYDVALIDLLKAYGDIKQRSAGQHYDLPSFHLMSMDNALQRMTRMLGRLPKSGMNSVWTTFESFLPEDIKTRLYGRSALTSMLSAGLELAKQGRLEMRQEGLYKPIYMRGIDSSSG